MIEITSDPHRLLLDSEETPSWQKGCDADRAIFAPVLNATPILLACQEVYCQTLMQASAAWAGLFPPPPAAPEHEIIAEMEF